MGMESVRSASEAYVNINSRYFIWLGHVLEISLIMNLRLYDSLLNFL